MSEPITRKQFKQQLETRWPDFTTSEQRIATYLLAHLDAIPFETASSLSEKIGVSPMTVSRFLRNLGYRGIGALKQALRHDSPWLQLYRARATPRGTDWISQGLQAEIRSLEAVYSLAKTREWDRIVHKIADARQLVVPSFPLTGPIALGLVSLLQQIKPHTRLADGSDGAYIDALLDIADDGCLVLIDFRRYSRPFKILAEEAAGRNVPFVVITDTQCHWARPLTRDVLMMPIDGNRLWHSYGPVFVLLSLLIEAVMSKLDGAYERIEEIVDLRNRFVGYADSTQAGSLRKSPSPHNRGKGKKS